MDLYPTWMSGDRTGVSGYPYPVDAMTINLEGDVEVLLADDAINVVVENEMTGEVDQSGITGVVSGDTDVELECS